MLGTVLAGVHSFEKPSMAHASKNTHKPVEHRQVQTHKTHNAPKEATSVTSHDDVTSKTTVPGEATSVTSKTTVNKVMAQTSCTTIEGE